MEVSADQLQLVATALYVLQRAEPIWFCNYKTFKAMPYEKQIQWWLHAQQMSDQGLPMYRTLISKVIELRMNQ